MKDPHSSLKNKLAYWQDQRNEADRKIREIRALLAGDEPRKHSTVEGECSHCGQTVRVRKDGKPFAHTQAPGELFNCEGVRMKART